MSVYLIFVVLMLAMAIGTYSYNKILSFIEIGVSIAAFTAVLLFTVNFKKYVKRVVTQALDASFNVNEKSIEQFRLPVAVVGEYGEILYCNARFKKTFSTDSELENDRIFPYISDNELSYVGRIDSLETEYKGRKFTVYARKVASGLMLMYVDNTFYKNIVDDYNKTKKSVGMIVFDNPEDFSSDEDPEGETSRITAERYLYRWAEKHNTLLRKLSDGKFVAIFDDEVLQKQIEKKFKILDRIRTVTIGSRSVTVSIGIGRDCKTLTESSKEAKKALDMAQGRGGDQVAVLSKGEYKFFGGVSKSVEKTSKVRVRVIEVDEKGKVSLDHGSRQRADHGSPVFRP